MVTDLAVTALGAAVGGAVALEVDRFELDVGVTITHSPIASSDRVVLEVFVNRVTVPKATFFLPVLVFTRAPAALAAVTSPATLSKPAKLVGPVEPLPLLTELWVLGEPPPQAAAVRATTANPIGAAMFRGLLILAPGPEFIGHSLRSASIGANRAALVAG
jgi:hypothetical protein